MSKNINDYTHPIFAWQDDSWGWEDDLEEIFDDFVYQYCDGKECPHAESCNILMGTETVIFCAKNTGKGITAYIAERVEVLTTELVSGMGWSLQDLIQESSYEEVGEACESWCEEVEKILKNDNNASELEKLVSDWIEKKVGKPTFYKLEDMQEIDVLEYLEAEND